MKILHIAAFLILLAVVAFYGHRYYMAHTRHHTAQDLAQSSGDSVKIQASAENRRGVSSVGY